MEGNGVDAPRLSAARMEFQSNGAHQLLDENPREEVTVPKSSMLSAPEQHGDGDVVQDIHALGAAAQVLRDCSAAGAQEAAPMGRDPPNASFGGLTRARLSLLCYNGLMIYLPMFSRNRLYIGLDLTSTVV